MVVQLASDTHVFVMFLFLLFVFDPDYDDTTNFPEVFLEAALASYRIARVVRYGPFAADKRYANRGVVAGCSLATTLVKLYVVRNLDKLVETFPSVKWNVFLNDVAVACAGSPHTIAEEVAAAVEALRELLLVDGCELAPSKT